MTELIEELAERIAKLEKRVVVLESRLSDEKEQTGVDAKQSKTQSVREFLMTKKPTTANDHTLVLGHYIEQVSGQGYFSADDVRAAYRSAKLPGPKNVNDTINKNIVKGFMMESGLADLPVKTWVLTASGEEYVGKELNPQE